MGKLQQQQNPFPDTDEWPQKPLSEFTYLVVFYSPLLTIQPSHLL